MHIVLPKMPNLTMFITQNQQLSPLLQSFIKGFFQFDNVIAIRTSQTIINHCSMLCDCRTSVCTNLLYSFYQQIEIILIIIFKMFQNCNTQGNYQEIQVQNQLSKIKSSFKIINQLGTNTDMAESSNFQKDEKLNAKRSRRLLPSSSFKSPNQDIELWSKSQIEKLFKLYDLYGPQWKVMSQQMPLRTANNLKNRFYTVLRNLIKLLFRKKGQVCPKLSGQIPSKDLSRLYDGKQDYIEFKSLVRLILQQMNYNLQSQNIEFVAKEYSQEIIKIYQIMYRDRLLNDEQEQRVMSRKTSQIYPNLTTSSNYFKKQKQHEGYIKMGLEAMRQKNQAPGGIFQQANIVYFVFFNPYDLYQAQGI